MDIFDPIIQVFQFIVTLLDTIINGIVGILAIIGGLLDIFEQIFKILPNPLYPCFLTFLAVYLAIFTYKIFRQG